MYAYGNVSVPVYPSPYLSIPTASSCTNMKDVTFSRIAESVTTQTKVRRTSITSKRMELHCESEVVIPTTSTFQSKPLSVNVVSDEGSAVRAIRYGEDPSGSAMKLYINVLTSELVKRAFVKVDDVVALTDKTKFVCVGSVDKKFYPLKFAVKGEIEGSQKGAWDFFGDAVLQELLPPGELNLHRESSYIMKANVLQEMLQNVEGTCRTAPKDSKDLHFRFNIICSESRCKRHKAKGSPSCDDTCIRCPMKGSVGGKYSFYFDGEGKTHILSTYTTIALFLNSNECCHDPKLTTVPNFCKVERTKKELKELIIVGGPKQVRFVHCHSSNLLYQAF
jgi:hypothetical protein